MKELAKENLSKFLEYYHNLHDSYILKINYNVFDSKLELMLDVTWSDKPTLKNDKTYETNKTKLKMLFNDIKTFNIKDYFSWDYIDEVYIKYIKLDKKEYICFASDKNNPLIYIVCNDIEFEEISKGK